MSGLFINLKEAIKVVKVCFEKFPSHCKSGNELDFLLKDNCPVCIADPIESLSNAKYHKKYPANNVLKLGATKIYLCDKHFQELRKRMNEMEAKRS